MGDPSRDRITCPECGQAFWIFAGEAFRCPHCCAEATGIDVAACINVSILTDLSDQLTTARPIDLTAIAFPAGVAELLPEKLARTHTVLPIACNDGGLTIAVAPEISTDTLEELRFVLNRELRIVTASADSILTAIDRLYGAG